MCVCVRSGPDMRQTRTCSQTCFCMIEGGSSLQDSVRSLQKWVVRPRHRDDKLCVLAEPVSRVKMSENSMKRLQGLVQVCGQGARKERTLGKQEERESGRESVRERKGARQLISSKSA